MFSFRIYLLLLFLGLQLACTGDQANVTQKKLSSKARSEKRQEPAAEVAHTAPTSQTVHPDSIPYRYPWKKDYDVRQALLYQIAVPEGFQRVKTRPNSFGDWLRFLPLAAPGTKVHYFDGREKWSQDLHERVVDLDIGKKDLQQCADAIMRLRAEFHYSQAAYDQIHFNFTSGDRVAFDDWRKGKKPIVKGNRVRFSTATGEVDNSYSNFKAYLQQIFYYAGTASLSKELRSLSMEEMEVGDLFIQGGHPGHAVLVMDMVENAEGRKMYLLAQSYMPAQSFHILKNTEDPSLGPWHVLHQREKQETAQWSFTAKDLKRF